MPYSIERPRYWPRWMNTRYPPTSGSLLSSFWVASWITQYVDLRRDLDDYLGGKTYSSWGQPRLGWLSYVSETENKDLDINFKSSISSGAVTRATNIFDFMHSLVPVFYVDSFGVILYRNLEIVETTTTPGSDYSIWLSPLVEDTDIWYKAGTAFERLSCRSIDVDAASGVIYLPYNHPVIVKYSPKYTTDSLDSSGFVQINGGPWHPLLKHDLLNVWDNIGLTRDIARLPREDNFNYYSRQKSCYYIKGGTTKHRLSSEIARRLDLITSFSWTPTGSILLSDLGILDAVELVVYTINKDYVRVENLRKISDNIYRATRIPNAGTLRVTVGGYLTQPVSSTDNTIFFYSPPNNAAQANYGFTSYNITRDASGYITLLSPVSGNIDANQTYLVYVARAVKAYTLSANDYKTRLYNPDGSGTNYLHELSNSIGNSIKITLGKTQWDRAVWFTDDDVKPEIKYVPRVLDIP